MNLTRENRYAIKGKEVNGGTTLSVTTYNILADFHIDEKDYPEVSGTEYLYRGHGNDSFRHQLLLKELDFLDSDVLLLQEIDENYVPILREELNGRGYEFSFFCKKEPTNEGNAICYRKKVLTCLRTYKICIHDEIRKCAQNENIDVVMIDEKLKKEHVFQICVFKVIKNSRIVIVATTHSVWDSLRQPALQALQAALLCQKVDEVRKVMAQEQRLEIKDIAVIIGGDFNVEPSFHTMTMMKKGSLDAQELNELKYLTYVNDRQVRAEHACPCVEYLGKYLSNPLNLASAYETIMNEEPLVTSATFDFNGSLDYIFHTENASVFSILEISEELAKSYQNGGPNSQFSSDHLPLKAVFVV